MFSNGNYTILFYICTCFFNFKHDVNKMFTKIETDAATFNEFLVVLGQPEHNFSKVEEVREIIDAAIKHVDRKNLSHFMDVLVGKRYDEEDYIVLRAMKINN